MNKSLIFGVLAVIALLISVPNFIEIPILFPLFIIGIVLGIISFIMGCIEIKKRMRPTQAIIGLILGLGSGILLPVYLVFIISQAMSRGISFHI